MWSGTIRFDNPSALTFDGVNKGLELQNDQGNELFNFGAGEEFTLSVWVRGSDTTQDQNVIDKRGTAGYQLRFTVG